MSDAPIQQQLDDDCLVCVTAMCADVSYDELIEEVDTPMHMAAAYDALIGSDYDCVYTTDGALSLGALRMQQQAGMVDGAIITAESPVSERDEDLFWEYTTEQDSLKPLHAVAYVDGKLYDPKPDPYWETMHDLQTSPYDVSSILAYNE